MAAHDDIPLTDDELALARRGAALVAAAVAHPEARAPQRLRDAVAGPTTPARSAAPAHLPPVAPPRTPEPAEPAAGERPPERRRSRRPRRWLVAPGLGLACVLVLAFTLVLRGHDAGGPHPSVLEVAAVTRLPAKEGAPGKVGQGGRWPRLTAAVEGVSFPDWSRDFDWTTTGRRMDRVGGRAVTTVFYRYHDGTMLGYAIVAGAPLRTPAGRDVVRSGKRYRVVERGGRTTVTWTEAGHTCVLDASSEVAPATLVALADWANA